MQIGTLAADSTYLPADGPITQGEPCFAIYANIQQALSAGEITLAAPDPAVQPAINYNYLAHPWDRERLREAVRRAYRLAQHPAFQDVIIELVGIDEETIATDAALDAWLLGSIGFAGFHSAGTCKMGPASDAMAVVDQYCRVHGLEGLRVVDASVMPDVVRANTNTTTIAIAERVADWMKAGR